MPSLEFICGALPARLMLKVEARLEHFVHSARRRANYNSADHPSTGEWSKNSNHTHHLDSDEDGCCPGESKHKDRTMIAAFIANARKYGFDDERLLEMVRMTAPSTDFLEDSSSSCC
jgi:hypothetical protein